MVTRTLTSRHARPARFSARSAPRARVPAAVAARMLLALAALAGAGCTRKATEADCQLIVDRLVELELRAQKTTDPSAIQKKQEVIRGTMKEELKDCTGRRVSDGMMACVKTADAPEAVLACIR